MRKKTLHQSVTTSQIAQALADNGMRPKSGYGFVQGRKKSRAPVTGVRHGQVEFCHCLLVPVGRCFKVERKTI